jgi:hypothetical protein
LAPVPPTEQAIDAGDVDAFGAARTASGISSRVNAAIGGSAIGRVAFHSHAREYLWATYAAVRLMPVVQR